MLTARPPSRGARLLALSVASLFALALAGLGLSSRLALAAEAAGSADRHLSASKTEEAPGAKGAWFFPARTKGAQTRSIQSGVRVERQPSGQLEVASEWFGPGGETQGVAIPALLGGGVVFYQSLARQGQNGTAIWRSESWTGPLQKLSFVPFTVSRIVVGFDRLYLVGGGHRMGLDPTDGRWLSLDPLPVVATIGGLSLSADGSGEIIAPLVGRLSTLDSGVNWVATPVGEDERSVRTFARAGRQGAASRDGATRDTGLVESALQGVFLGDEVLMLSSGQAHVFDPRQGRTTSHEVKTLSPRAQCQGYEGSESRVWFYCSSEAGVQVYEWRLGQRPRLAHSLPAASRPLAGGPAGLLLRDCGTRAAASAQAALSGSCLATARELVPVPLQGLVRSFVLVGSDDVVEGSLEGSEVVLRSRWRRRKTRRFKLPEERVLKSLIAQGRWLPQASRTSDGVTFWAAQNERFVGILLEDEGWLRTGAVQTPLRRALLAGRRGLSWGASGFGRLTVDGGVTWKEVSLPFRSGDLDPGTPRTPAERLVVGCGPAGCALGSWVRFGWGDQELGHRLAPIPDLVQSPQQRVPRMRFSCVSTGKRSLPTVGQARPPSRGRSRTAATSLQPFWEEAREPLLPGWQAVRLSDSHHRVSFEAYGPADGSWRYDGRARVRYWDPFRLDGVGASRETSGLFPDLVGAELELGALERVSQSVQLALDPAGDAGLVLSRSQQSSALFSFRRGEALQRLSLQPEVQLRSFAGAVQEAGHWAVGTVQSSRFRLLVEKRGRLHEVASYPLFDLGTRNIGLVRSLDGHLGIALDGDEGLVVYPVGSQQNGYALGSPLQVARSQERSELCASEAQGFIVEREVSATTPIDLGEQRLAISRLRRRMLVTPAGSCLLGLAGNLRDKSAAERLSTARGSSRGTVPFILSDAHAGGRRHELACK